MRILYVDAIKATHAQNNVNGLLSAFRLYSHVDTFDYRTLTKISSSSQMNKALLKLCIKNKYDLIFLGKCESVFGSTIQEIKQQTSSFVISFLGDFYWTPCPFKFEQNQFADLSLFSYFEKRILDQYKTNNVGYWTDGCNLDQDKNLHIEKEYDVVFMGSNYIDKNLLGLDNYSFRYELMKKIDEKYKLAVYGNNWNLKHVFPWVTNEEKTIATNKAKISIGVTAVDNAFLYLSWPRVFHSMACGTVHLTQYVPGLELMFKNHKDILWYKTINDAIMLLDYYLKHDDELSKIARLGQEKALDHTYVNRVKGIIDCTIKNGLFDYLGTSTVS